MEQLFVGNVLILLFWVFISFIIEVKEKYKKIILMYLVTYITNVLNIVPTFQSYAILLLALFLEIEFGDDKFKKQIINNGLEKVIDFLYLMISQYALISFSASLVLSSDLVLNRFRGWLRIVVLITSGLTVYLSCKHASSERYKIASFDVIKRRIDDIEKYRKFLLKENSISAPECVLGIEDAGFYERGDAYTFFNTYYLRNSYLKKVRIVFKRFMSSSNKKASFKRFLRGYSTIEMQLLRTLAIEEGYNCIVRRKIFEVLYARLFWKNLRLYYRYCECDIGRFKEYLLYLYLRKAPCLNKGQEHKFEMVVKPRNKIESYSPEELFILTLCFSGKIKRDYVLEIYEELIDWYGLDRERLEELVYKLNC